MEEGFIRKRFFQGKTRRILRWVVTLAILAVLYIVAREIAGYLARPPLQMLQSPIAGPLAVSAEPAKVGEVVHKVTYTGSISPREEVDVLARVEGWLRDFDLYEGDYVKRGQRIGRLEAQELKARADQASFMVVQAEREIQQAEAQVLGAQANLRRAQEERTQAEAAKLEATAGLHRARAQVAEAESGVHAAEAKLEEARADLNRALPLVGQFKAELEYQKAEYGRDEKLVAAGAIANSIFDQRRALYLTAQEKVAQARATVRQMEAGIETAQANLRSAKARLETARAMVAEWEAKVQRAEAGIRRALAGQELAERHLEHMKALLETAKARRAQAQEEVKNRQVILSYTDVYAPITGSVTKRHVYAGTLLKPGMPIVTIADASRMRVQVKVAENDIPSVRVGTEARIKFPSLPNPHNEHRARVSTVFPKLDPATRTGTVEMVIENPKGLIKADMYAIVDLILERRQRAITIPRLAVVEVEGKPTVFTVEGTIAKANEVKLGLTEGEKIEVIEGIKEGDMVIYKGNRGLVDGQEVAVIPTS